MSTFHLGVVIRLIRIQKDLTIPELAKRANLNPKTVSSIERDGDHKPMYDTLDVIAKALDLPDASALQYYQRQWAAEVVGPVSELPPYQQRLLAQYAVLTPREQQVIMDMIIALTQRH